MCGIFGFSRLTPVTRAMAPYLAWEMESRGRDSWGATDGNDILKHLGPITSSWHSIYDTDEWQRWERMIVHTRAASTGAVTIENQHPFVIENNGKKYVGIHNGIVTNHDELNRKHKRTFDCDSPHIYMASAGFSNPFDISGYGNLAWYQIEGQGEPVLKICRFNADNLNVFKLATGEIVFCSTSEPVRKAAKMAGSEVKTVVNIDPEKEHTIRPSNDDPNVDEVYTGRRINFGYRYNTNHNTPFYSVGHNGHVNDHRRPGLVKVKNPSLAGARDRQNNMCIATGCNNKVRRSRAKELLCESCFGPIMDRIVREQVNEEQVTV